MTEQSPNTHEIFPANSSIPQEEHLVSTGLAVVHAGGGALR